MDGFTSKALWTAGEGSLVAEAGEVAVRSFVFTVLGVEGEKGDAKDIVHKARTRAGHAAVEMGRNKRQGVVGGGC